MQLEPTNEIEIDIKRQIFKLNNNTDLSEIKTHLRETGSIES